MKPIQKPALIAAIIGPIQSVLGWVLAASLWPEYNPVTQTISDLAAPESPVKWIMSTFFILGGVLTLVISVYAKTFALPGRVALFLAALCTFGLTIFPTPLIGYSTLHRVFAISSFVLSAGWPILAMRNRKDAPWIVRPLASVAITAIQVSLALWFLSTWTDPSASSVGVWERVVAVSQSFCVTLLVLGCYFGHGRAIR